MLTHLQRNISDEILPPFKTMGALKLISVELGFYPVCKVRYAGHSSSPGLFWKKQQNQETAMTLTPLQAAVLVEMGNSCNLL